MTYLVLARKWRPRSFDTLVGQDHVVRALTHALSTQRLHHAWLFTGTRGVGKTTLSRILAKSLNCENGITATPCDTCRACVEIDAGRFVDYVELDAASNRGVDEMTQLLEQAVYSPSSGRFKVYMIDEVHMLTGHAFNAMLKTLEEPPPHVKFILATTDPQKIPVTVLSRCLQFNLKQMTSESIVAHLQEVLAQEDMPFEVPALRLIAQAASGSMRDALSLTDQAIAYSAGNLTLDALQGMLGTIDQRYLLRLLEALAAGSGAEVLRVADELATRGLSFSGALADLAVLLSKLAIQQRIPGALDTGEPLADEIVRLAGLLHPDLVQLFYSVAVHSRNELSLAPDEYAGFVMACLRMLALAPSGPQADEAPDPTAVQKAPPTSMPTAVKGASEAAAQTEAAQAAVAETSPAGTTGSAAEPIAEATAIAATEPASDPTPKSPAAPGAAKNPDGLSDVPDAEAPASDVRASPETHATGFGAAPQAHIPSQASTPSQPSSPEPVEARPSAETPADLIGAQAQTTTPLVPGALQAEVSASAQKPDASLNTQAKPTESPADASHAFAADDIPAWEDIPPDVDAGQFEPYQEIDDLDGDDAYVMSDDHADIGLEAVEPTSAAAAVFAAGRTKIRSPRLSKMNGKAWPALAAQLPVTGLAAELARQSEWLGVQDDEIRLRVAVRTLAATAGKARLRTVLSEHFGTVVQLDVEFGATGEETAHAVAQAERAARQKQAEHDVQLDPVVRALIQDFGAQIVPGSVRAVFNSPSA